jgi:GMP synthase (glutamine-hydrolysing)
MHLNLKDKKEIWAIQHIGYEDLGSFYPVFEQRGYKVKYYCSRHVDYRQLDAIDPALLVVLGGPMSLYEEDKNPWVPQERKFVSDRIESGLPLLGICFGAQMIASALGAKVYKGEQGKEIGWTKLTVNNDGMKTPLKYLDGDNTMMMHWHGDSYDLPDGAVRLASSNKYKDQAFSYDDHVLAIQCHPEVTEAKLRLWYTGNQADLHELGITAKQMMDNATQYQANLTHQAQLFLNEWMDGQGL